MIADVPEPPAHLSASAADLWREVLRAFMLEAHHVRLLEAACSAWDRMSEARVELAVHGALTFTDPKGIVRAHPSVAIERDARIAFARLVRELGLDGGALPEAARPPVLPGNRR